MTTILWLILIVLIPGISAHQDICSSIPTNDSQILTNVFKDTDLAPITKSNNYKTIIANNCTYQYFNDNYTITGNNCNYIKINKNSNVTDINIEQTQILVIKSFYFTDFIQIKALHIKRNPNLVKIESNAFYNLTKLENLTITSNPQLQIFEKDCFKGLINLKQLALINNKITKISQISSSLKYSYLPSLYFIDLRENHIVRIDENEFQPMANSSLNVLIMSSTKTEFIHPNALDPLNNLKRLNFCQNKINGTTSANLIKNVKINKKLINLSMAANSLFNDISVLLSEVANSSITNLDISNIYFQELQPGFFPEMPNIESLDLTNIMINDLPNGLINSTLFPKLSELKLCKNNLRELNANIESNTVRKLDLCQMNSNNLAWNIDFKIINTAFDTLPELNWLSLTGTRLTTINKDTFSKAINLKYLSLQDTMLNRLEMLSFRNNNNLIYLDLSKNTFFIFQSVNRSLFIGLNKLLALDLSYNHISSLSPNVFSPLINLKYLNLRMNSISNLNGDIVNSIPCLLTLDLKYNAMMAWNNKLINNNLKELYLDFNHISSISSDMVKDFNNLKQVSLRGNSIECNCLLINTVTKNSNFKSFSLLPFNSTDDQCVNINETIVSYIRKNAYSYECREYKWLIPLIISLILLILLLLLIYFIYYNYRLSIEFAYLTLKEKLGLIKFRGRNLDEKLDGSEKDAFVSYSCEDESFVEKMVFILESEGFDLILYRRDFNVGDIIPDRILEAIDNSRKTILVLSESFAKSQWCLWEMYIAQFRSITLQHSENEPLLLIKKSEISEEYMTPTLKHLLKTRVFLQWHESPMKQKMFWHQLKLALDKPVKQIQVST